MEEYVDLITASQAFPEIPDKHFMFISKGGYAKSVKESAKKEGAMLKTVEDLFYLIQDK